MQLVVSPTGFVRAIYEEALDLTVLGPLEVRRASHVEPDAAGLWWADLTPVAGPVLGPFPLRSRALAAEVSWLDRFWLSQGPSPYAPLGRDQDVVLP